MRKLILTAAVTTILGVTGTALQLKTPVDWKWRTDTPAAVTDTDKALPADKWFYVGMPPGWHITTNPGVRLPLFSIVSQYFLSASIDTCLANCCACLARCWVRPSLSVA